MINFRQNACPELFSCCWTGRATDILETDYSGLCNSYSSENIQQKTLNQYKSEASTYSEQLETAKETNSELQKTKENVNSTEYIEEVAREKLDMYLPNERVYIDISK